MIKINGEMFDAGEIPLKEFLDNNGYHSKKIAVERNEMIVPKSDYESCILHSGDIVEIVTLVGGG